MAFTLAEIALRFGGRVVGDPQVLIRQVGTLERAGAGEIAFLANPRYRARLAGTRAAAVIVSPEDESLTALPRIVCDNPYAYYARVSQLLNPPTAQAPGVHPSAVVAPSARLGARVSIGAGCVVGDGVAIGDDSCLYPRVVVYHGCRIGARAILHSGAVIGADGFGLAMEGGRWLKIPQIGGVVLGDDVEIGAGTTVDRGALGDTVIEDGVKLDNLIQIAHNVRIGAHTAIAAMSGVAGSARVGARCMIGGCSCINGHIEIADDVIIIGFSMVTKSITEKGQYGSGFPAQPAREWRRGVAGVRRLGHLEDRLAELERRAGIVRGGHGQGQGEDDGGDQDV